MPHLSEEDWLLLNDLVYSVNAIAKDFEMRTHFLETLRYLVPYHSASFYCADLTKDNKLIKPVGVDYSEDKQLAYDQYYYKLDYSRKLFYLSKSIVYRETDLLENSEREKTEYFHDYLQPEIQYVGNVIFANQTGLFGNVSLSRTKRQGDFSERELFILRQLEPHLTNRLYQERQQSMAQRNRLSSFDNRFFANKYKLTSREIEILDLVLHGLTNAEISEKLFISLGTVKKHVSSIFEKMGINNRTQLFFLE